ncbi:hypothetical protein GCM10010156_34150 [Planobispora rosea]|uniref:AAA domain-containing protein n=1 Tax=Planobispora rosea TaxID=35762 RepID=A0A8J3WCT9_PLARO|nr:hypothetical protein GCM10010156_34150 [Planobispora rosea]GIH85279.1 hypothetical protein Pro02_36870 [Planobispora rosea]
MTEAPADTRAIVVNGARQVGKRALAKMITGRLPDARELYLDDPATPAAARDDPRGLVHHDG